MLGGVHFIEVHLQQKTVGGTEISVQSGGVHFIEVFTKGGFTVFRKKRNHIGGSLLKSFEVFEILKS